MAGHPWSVHAERDPQKALEPAAVYASPVQPPTQLCRSHRGLLGRPLTTRSVRGGMAQVPKRLTRGNVVRLKVGCGMTERWG